MEIKEIADQLSQINERISRLEQAQKRKEVKSDYVV